MTSKRVRIALCMATSIMAGCTLPNSDPFRSPSVPPSSLPFDSPLAIAPLNSPISVDAVRFEFDRPVRAGDTQVQGSGPAGIPIVVSIVTTMGEVLGSGTISPDSRFAITVPPLTVDIRIGIALGDLSGTGREYDEFNHDEYKGEGALLVPLVGYYLDTVLVEP